MNRSTGPARSPLLLNPFFIGGVMTIVVILLTAGLTDKYRIVKVSAINVSRESRNYFHDLDGDGLWEWIELGFDRNDENFPYYIVYNDLEGNHSRLIDDQHNLDKKWLPQSKALFGDVDGDQKDEILFFTLSNDSLFLFCGDPFDGVPLLFEAFIETVSFRGDSPDFDANLLECQDFNGDGFREVLLEVNAGFSLSPREYFIYNFHNDTLLVSHTQFAHVSGAGIYRSAGLGTLILPVRSYSPQNVSFPAVYSDTLSWLVLLDHNLDFVFPPVANPGYKTNIQSRFRLEKDSLFVYALFSDHDKKQNPPRLRKYDLKGNLRNERIIDVGKYPDITLASTGPGEPVYLKDPVRLTLEEIHPDLQTGKRHSAYLADMPIKADLNHDGKAELLNIRITNEYELYVCQPNLRHPVYQSLGPYPGLMILSPVNMADKSVSLAVQSDDTLTYYRFESNPLYYWNYAIYAGTWLGLSLFFLLLLQYQKRLLRKKYEQERKMTELELMTIKNQVDPHFMFNTMNSIGSFILKEDKNKAYKYLINFSQMIRSTLSHSRDISVMLEDEVAFVEKYLELEQLRANASFDYEITMETGIDTSVHIPKMIIQTFAENAVKHGLMHKKGPGQLEIKIWIEDDTLMIKIEDNGIGREGSRKLNTHGTGHGADIVAQIVSLFNRLNGTEVSYEIIDLNDEKGDPAGTRVMVRIPYQLSVLRVKG